MVCFQHISKFPEKNTILYTVPQIIYPNKCLMITYSFGRSPIQSTLNVIRFQTLLTCSQTGYICKPPFGDLGKNHNYSISSLQGTGFCKFIGKFPRQRSQFLKTPSHFFSISIYPPEGWIGRSLSSLRKGKPDDLKLLMQLNSILTDSVEYFLRRKFVGL